MFALIDFGLAWFDSSSLFSCFSPLEWEHCILEVCNTTFFLIFVGAHS
jgi:hypothetical protein